jgi:hypothetical protein
VQRRVPPRTGDARGPSSRTVRALADRYLDWLRSKNLDDGYINNIEHGLGDGVEPLTGSME